LSINPARDFGPRMAHYLMHIPGKGKSYFVYSAIINLAAFLGAVLGAVTFLVLKPIAIR
jgi:glycerol uptake facilitator protein